MSVIWKYLDKRSATVSALKDFRNMQFIIDHTGDEIREAYRRMSGIGSPQYDGMPHAHNPQAGEERIIKGIDEIDVLKERYRQAVEYMAWFKPAWEELTEEERYVLEVFYSEEESQTEPFTTSATVSISSVLPPTTKRTALFGSWYAAVWEVLTTA